MYKIVFFNGNLENENLMNSIFRRLNRDLKAKTSFDFISQLTDLEDLQIKEGCCVVEPYMSHLTQLCLEKIQGCRKRGLKIIIYSTQIMQGALPSFEEGIHYDHLVENSDQLIGLLEKLIS